MRLSFATIFGLLLISLGVSSGTASGQTKLLRFPDLHGDKVVFTYGGDLWTASTDGGLARRLTAHPGLELFPKFSPDGEMIAFTGQYDGDEQVYVIPSSGGEPKRLTHYPAAGPLPPRWGYDHQVYGWTPDGKSVLFRSMRDGWGLTDTQLFTVPAEGGLAESLPMPVSGGGTFSPDGDKVVYSPLTRDFRTWKRYQGGWAQDLYIFDLESKELTPVAHSPRTERDPMWIGDKIYFASDRSGTLNLYAFDPETEEVEALTESKTWDVRWPSAGDDNRIIYESAGELRIIDVDSGEDQKIEIQVPDDGLSRRPERRQVADNIEDFGLSPKGERALFVARGDVFTAPIEKGVTRNLTRSSDAHDKHARWSPDGKYIAYISDKSGEEEVYIIAQDGSGEARQLTEGGKAMRYAPEWSPDSQQIAFSDKDGKIYVLDVESKDLKEIVDDEGGQVRDYIWSPDSRFLAFSLSEPNEFRSVQIWSKEDDKVHRVTDPLFNSYSPAWDPDGSFLYFLSDRSYAPQLDTREWNYASSREVSIHAIALRKDVKHPFPPESDEVTIDEDDESEDEADPEEEDKDKEDKDKEDEDKEDEDKEDEDKDKKEKDESKQVKIDFEGIVQRAVRVPVPAENYSNLMAKNGHLIYSKTAASFYGRESENPPALMIYSLKDREATEFASGVSGAALSSDGSKILVRQGNNFFLANAAPKGFDSKKPVSTSGLEVDRVPEEEWRQIFGEVWRRYRDFFYVENMHGYDWEALREQYEPLLDHVAHRSDLNYVIGEMIAELNVGHAYIEGGDYEIPDRPKVALLGVRLELDEDSGRYRVARILPGHNEEPNYRSPLTEVGVDISEGDYILAIDGVPLETDDDPYRLLRHKADRPITLEVNDEPKREGSRKVTIEPVANEDDLLYLEWVLENRRKVEEATDGRVGYLHLPDMGPKGIQEFIKWFYPQIRKEGLVIDVRNNGGGNVSQMIINRLSRDLLGTRFNRTSDRPGTYPGTVFHGHMVCLINANSASDGDIFPARFKSAGLGPLIGKRSWGGVIGITGRGPLIDGGTVFVPEFGTNDVDGSWIIEGYGVDPDIELDNEPKALLEGRDPQLERGIEEVLKRIEADPKTLPDRPEDPVKLD